MSPSRIPGDANANFRFDRVFPGVGRIQRSAGTNRIAEFRKRDTILTKLFENSQLEVLRSFQRGEITIEQLVEADRVGRLKGADLMSEMAMRQPLWTAIDETLPKMGNGEETRRRYFTSLAKLQRLDARWLPSHAQVGDLAAVDWKQLAAQWLGSAADWNHMRRALSTFLTTALGDVYHPLRRSVMRQISLRPERPRVPDLSVENFWRIRADARARASVLRRARGQRNAAGRIPALHEGQPPPGPLRYSRPRHQDGGQRGSHLRRRGPLAVDRSRGSLAASKEVDVDLLEAGVPSGRPARAPAPRPTPLLLATRRRGGRVDGDGDGGAAALEPGDDARLQDAQGEGRGRPHGRKGAHAPKGKLMRTRNAEGPSEGRIEGLGVPSGAFASRVVRLSPLRSTLAQPRDTTRAGLKIRVSLVRFRPWPLSSDNSKKA